MARGAAVLLSALLAIGAARAHAFSFTEVTAVLERDGTYVVDVTVDLDALALGVSPAEDSAALAAALTAMEPSELAARTERVKQSLVRRLRVRFDGVKQRPDVSFPDHRTPAATEAETPTVLGTTARLTGEVPAGAREFTFGASRVFREVHLAIVDRAAAVEVRYVLGVAEDSPPHSLGTPAATPGRLAVALDYASLGFRHILPRGLDHILFVLGLFLLSVRLRPLLWQVTAFTVAHTITLALSVGGVVSLSPRWVEPLIALSICYVAVENLFTTELKPWRPVLVFCFGLLHGLGFAGVLRDLGLPRGELVTALLSFNVGVELGQLAVIALAFLAVGWYRSAARYRRVVVIPASTIIAATGLWWTLERGLGI